MTQLELPPISFARYFELLKRRRWQVLPITIVGLVVGAFVALMIPRYYVAKATIEFRGTVLGAELGREDPMLELIETAQISIPWALADALQQLKWPEALIADAAERARAQEQIRDRISVADLNRDKKKRMVAQIEVSYKDTDGYRAKELVDALSLAWIEKQKRELRELVSSEQQANNREIDVERKGRDDIEREIAQFLRNQKIDPRDLQARPQGERSSSPLSQDREETRARIAAEATKFDMLTATLELRRKQLEREPPTVPRAETEALPAEALPLLQELLARRVRIDQALEGQREGHPDREFLLSQKRAIEQNIADLKALYTGAPTDEVENPEHVGLARQVSELEAQVAATEQTLARERAHAAALDAQIEALPDVDRQYRALVAEGTRHEDKLQRLREQEGRLEERHRELITREAYKIIAYAQVPPRPTEPNVTLVALAGCAVGLAFAIGLILLIDAVQSSFKTIDDVERVLALPVLGSLSHLTTAEQRQLQTARRTRIAAAASVFLVLALSLITFYYVAPTRLPGVVRDLFDLLLGGPPAATPR